MPTTLGALRSLMMTPSLASVGFAARGFPVEETEATRRLEAIPQSVVCGFEWAIDARTLWEVERRLDLVEPEMRGFVYEGATMAYTIRDAMAGGRGTRARELLRGSAQPHVFLTYIGIGFAMARLPRPLWARVLPDLTGTPYFPTMSWLAVDGLGFDRAYFDTDRWVGRRKRPRPYPWQGHPDYFPRAFDQGVGRALWFIHGGRPAAVANAVERFEPDRHGDLWSGVGLAATFAGGSDCDDLLALRRLSGTHVAELGQGAVFAAKARDFAGFVPAHTEQAVGILAGLPVSAASALADEVTTGRPEEGGPPLYETWRARLRAALTRRAALPPS